MKLEKHYCGIIKSSIWEVINEDNVQIGIKGLVPFFQKIYSQGCVHGNTETRALLYIVKISLIDKALSSIMANGPVRRNRRRGIYSGTITLKNKNFIQGYI